MSVIISRVRLGVHRQTRGYDSGQVRALVDAERVRYGPAGWTCTCTRTNSSDTSSSSDVCRHVEQVRQLIDPRVLEGIQLGKRESQATEHRMRRVAENWTAKHGER